jgi:ABC-type glycerol-3-phosphate transport system permease component
VLGFYIAPQSILIPLVRFMGVTGLYNKYGGLILTHTAIPRPIRIKVFPRLLKFITLYNYI